jgi:hypothetical protein
MLCCAVLCCAVLCCESYCINAEARGVITHGLRVIASTPTNHTYTQTTHKPSNILVGRPTQPPPKHCVRTARLLFGSERQKLVQSTTLFVLMR